MVRQTTSVHRRAALVFDQMSAADSLLREFSPDSVSGSRRDENNPYFELLDRLYTEDYALARLVDGSDLIVHAEGPAAKSNSPQLRAVNWICNGVDKQLRALASAVLQLSEKSTRELHKNLDLRLTGLAPGSLYAGFSLSPAEDGVLGLAVGNSEPAIAAVRDAVRSLPVIPSFIGDEHVSKEIVEAMPDPAVRDAKLMATYSLSPTGRVGIHTLEIGTPEHRPATLSNRERIVLRETAIKRPLVGDSKEGAFVGELRAVDLDAKRCFLRRVPNVGTIRCMVSFSESDARKFLGVPVKVTGRYESDNDGRPRMMRVDRVEPIAAGQQIDIELAE